MSLADDMVPAIRRRYDGMDVERVVDAWKKGVVGKVTTKEWEGKGVQVAASYVDGLHAEPWHNTERYPWIASLEANAPAIRDELRRVCADELQGGAAWAPAVGDAAEAYGSGWQKMILQDRAWDDAARGLFPKTCEVVRGCGAPSVDVFFARQRANSGIKPHTDNSNFFVTAHLALEVPDGSCWIQVGSERRKWLEGAALAFDSSFVHETKNDSTADRIILLVRFWHPQLTEVERSALDFIFDAMEDSSILDQPYEPAVEAVDPPTQPLEVVPTVPVPAIDAKSQGFVAAEPIGPEEEAVRLDGFLADLKSQGLLPGAGGKDDVLARGPKNRTDRRKASKSRRKASRPGKSKKH